jgi:hypothetical protein
LFVGNAYNKVIESCIHVGIAIGVPSRFFSLRLLLHLVADLYHQLDLYRLIVLLPFYLGSLCFCFILPFTGEPESTLLLHRGIRN